MFLSIIIPVYNVEDYIRECIESVINQNCDDYEVLLIENSSTDNSLNICKEYKENPKISIYTLPNPGVSHARNFGITKAKGQYLWFVDSDDLISPGAVVYLKKEITRLSFPNVLIFAHNEIINDSLAKQRVYTLKELDKTSAINGLFDTNLWSGFVWNKIFKNSPDLLSTYNFPENIHMIEDLVFTTRVFMHRDTFALTNNCLYSYRRREGSISSIFTEKKLSAFMAYDMILNELGNSVELEFARKTIGNAKVDFSRQILTHYYFEDKATYKTIKNTYKKIILKNFGHISSLKSKIGSFLTLISPKITKKVINYYEK